MSLPSWERGLKSVHKFVKHVLETVAPLVGAWIEIVFEQYSTLKEHVAPLVGAWIEMHILSLKPDTIVSLPSWERGLKSPALLNVGGHMWSLPSWERGLKYPDKFHSS